MACRQSPPLKRTIQQLVFARPLTFHGTQPTKSLVKQINNKKTLNNHNNMKKHIAQSVVVYAALLSTLLITLFLAQNIQAASGTPVWDRASLLSGDDTEYVYGFAIGSDGGQVIVGSSQKSITFGTYTLNNDRTSGFIFKVDNSTGSNTLWAKRVYSSTGNAYIYAVDVSKEDNSIVIAGMYTEDCNFGNDINGNPVVLTFVSNGDSFVAKYNADGALLWAIQHATSLEDHPEGISLDESDGSIYVTGWKYDTYPKENMFINKHDGSNGNLVWSKYLGASANAEAGKAIKVASDGVYVTGTIGGEWTWAAHDTTVGQFQGTSNGYSDMFIAKLHKTSGDALWVKTAGGAGTESYQADYGFAITVTQDNQFVYVGGRLNDNADFGNGNTVSGSGFLAKYNAEGNLVWSRGFDKEVSGLDVGSDDSVFVAVSESGAYRFDKNNNQLWHVTPSSAVVSKVALEHGTNRPYVAGIAKGSPSNFGTITVQPSSTPEVWDPFIARLTCPTNFDSSSYCDSCLSGFSGPSCAATITCNNTDSTLSSVCNSHGTCDSQDTCTCDGNWNPATYCSSCVANYGGSNCSQLTCDWLPNSYGAPKAVFSAAYSNGAIVLEVTVRKNPQVNTYYRLDTKMDGITSCSTDGDALVGSLGQSWTLASEDSCSKKYTLSQPLVDIYNGSKNPDSNNNWQYKLVNDGREIHHSVTVYGTYNINNGADDCSYVSFSSIVTLRSALTVESTSGFATADQKVKFRLNGILFNSNNELEVSAKITPILPVSSVQNIVFSKADGSLVFSPQNVQCTNAAGCDFVFKLSVDAAGGFGTDITGAFLVTLDELEGSKVTLTGQTIPINIQYVIPSGPIVIDGETIATEISLVTDFDTNTVRTSSYKTSETLNIENRITATSPNIPSDVKLVESEGYICCVNYGSLVLPVYSATTGKGGCKSSDGKVRFAYLGTLAAPAPGVTFLAGSDRKSYRVRANMNTLFNNPAPIGYSLSCEVLLISRLEQTGSRRVSITVASTTSTIKNLDDKFSASEMLTLVDATDEDGTNTASYTKQSSFMLVLTLIVAILLTYKL